MSNTKLVKDKLQRLFLGIDTSCYTTSVALLDDKGALAGEARQILSVKPGRCGLQQSEMVFQHTRNLPRLIEEAVAQVLQAEKFDAGGEEAECSQAAVVSDGSAGGFAGLAGAGYALAGIGVSGCPRPLEGSYMPAFLAGLSVARSLAAFTGAKLEVISHQENHL